MKIYREVGSLYLVNRKDNEGYVRPVYEIEVDEIVECKDCKFYEIAELKKDYTEDKRCKPSVCVKGYYAKPRKESWYCADGVRRDEEYEVTE